MAIARHFRLARDDMDRGRQAAGGLPLDGEQVMALLGLEPGPRVGAALDALREEAEAGEVAGAAEARAYLLRWAHGAAPNPGEGDGRETARGNRRLVP